MKNVNLLKLLTIPRPFRVCLSILAFGLFVHLCAAADFGDQELTYTDEPIKVRDHYPPEAEGHEDIYDRFVSGKLIYKPDPNSDKGKVELRIADLADPLNGTFDLSSCGDAGKYLSIATGYRKGKKAENEGKVEVWFAPRFLIEKELNGAAAHFKPIMDEWKEEAPVGMLWNWGGWDNMAWYDYLTTENMDDLSKINLYENYKKARYYLSFDAPDDDIAAFQVVDISCFVCDLKVRHEVT